MHAEVTIRIAEEGADAGRLQELTYAIRDELLELAVEDVVTVRRGEAPFGSRAIDVADVGALLVSVQGSMDLLRSMVSTVRPWLGGKHTGSRTVEFTVGDKSLRVTDVSGVQQDRLIDEFVRAVARE